MPASQHQSPKSDIEISQAAKKRPILDVAKEKLGIAAEYLDPYGHYKAKVSMDYIKSLQSKPNGKLILVTAITPTPASTRRPSTSPRARGSPDSSAGQAGSPLIRLLTHFLTLALNGTPHARVAASEAEIRH